MLRYVVLLGALLAACSQQPSATSTTSASLTVSARSASPTVPAASTSIRTASPSPLSLPGEVRLSAPSGPVVWALVAETHLFRSTDRGVTGQERPLPPILVTNGRPAFIDDREGWIAAPGAAASQCQIQGLTLWHTADAGATWERLPAAGIADGQCKGPLAFR